MKPTRLPIVAIAAGVVALAGCGGDSNSSSDSGSTGSSGQSASTGGGGGGQSVELSETEFKITPADPSVAKTGKVSFEVSNDGKIDHALEVEGPSGEAKTQTISPGSSATLTVDMSKAGTYEMYCPIDGHKAQGMVGKVAVAGGGSGTVKSDDDESDASGNSGY